MSGSPISSGEPPQVFNPELDDLDDAEQELESVHLDNLWPDIVKELDNGADAGSEISI